MSTDRGRIHRIRLLAFAALVVTFLAGALAGMAYERVLSASEPPVEKREGRHGSRGAQAFAPDGPLGDRLDLTAEQRAKIERILAEDRTKARAIFREMKPRLRARFDSTTAAVREVLTPEQRVEFERYRAERRAAMRKRYGRGGGDTLRHGPR